jgi:hypothetical protein
MRYAGWNFEKTLLVRETAGIARPGELVDVRLAVETEHAGSLQNDVRVILKKDWYVLDREVPSQVYAIERHGATTTFRVAFHMDLAPLQVQRVGVYYDNPTAPAPTYGSDVDVQGAGLGLKIETPYCAVETDATSGQLSAITAKSDVEGSTALRRLNSPGRVQEGNVVIVAQADGGACRAVALSAADWRAPEVVREVRGPLFFAQTRRGRLVPPEADPHRPWPELEVTYKFFAQLPCFLVHSRLTFPEDLGVFGVYNDVVSLHRAQFSHYTFRPVSPNLPLTDVEEMGHVVVDPAWTGDLPDGPALAGFLPLDLAWHAFINFHPLKELAVTGIQLLSDVRTPGGESILYRPATYLVREGQEVRWFRAPIYVETRDRPENIVRVPGATVFEELNALVISSWDPEWGARTDALGKRLNHPVAVTSHPVYVGEPAPAEAFETLPAGRRAAAYRRAGVR